MNRLIIVGNGFDKSIGMATGYGDFIDSIFQKAKLQLIDKLIYEDALIKIWHQYKRLDQSIKEKTIDVKSLIDLLKKNDYKIEYKSDYFQRVVGKSIENWVDCESEYFEGVKRIKNDKYLTSLKKYNQDFKIFRTELEIYLTSIIGLHDSGLSELAARYDRQFHELTTFGMDPLYNENSKKSISVGLNVVLNFNYTDNYKRLGSQFIYTEINKHIYIHGELNSKNNPIIFGHGDEHNPEFLRIEHLIDSDESEYIKSFNYVNQSNYANLIGFMDIGPFIVESFGHSLGLSDRTLLSEIVEHPNLHKFLIRYHKKPDGTDNFFELSFALSRHFKTKDRFRKITLSKDKLKPMPLI